MKCDILGKTIAASVVALGVLAAIGPAKAESCVIAVSPSGAITTSNACKELDLVILTRKNNGRNARRPDDVPYCKSRGVNMNCSVNINR